MDTSEEISLYDLEPNFEFDIANGNYIDYLDKYEDRVNEIFAEYIKNNGIVTLQVLKQFEEYNFNIDTKIEELNNLTPLEWYASKGDTENVRNILILGADPNVGNPSQEAILNYNNNLSKCDLRKLTIILKTLSQYGNENEVKNTINQMISIYKNLY